MRPLGAESTQPIVLVVDDDELVRGSLSELIQSVGLDVVCFASPDDLLSASIPERPGCLVLDVRMPGGSGLDLQGQLASHARNIPIVFLTGHGDIPMTVQAMKAGAVDFLTKPVRDQTLLDAVVAGIQRDVEQRAHRLKIKLCTTRFFSLTPREREVLREVAKGRLNKQIAFDFGISEVTVKLHRVNGMRKMQATNVSQLIRLWEILPADLMKTSLNQTSQGSLARSYS